MLGLRPGERALVVAAHPDDETLGMAGTIAALTGYGVEVDVIAVACLSGPMYGGTSDADIRCTEFRDACAVLGASGTIGWVDDERAANPGAHLGALVAVIEESLAASTPAAMFIPTGGHHQDHRAVHHAGLAAVRPGHRANRPLPRLILGFDGPEDRIWLSAGLDRPVAVDITTTMTIKQKALLCYPSQIRQDPHPRSVEKIQALDQAAGAARGVQAAELFALYRMEV
ncbi:PIG-L deacetylase family protein [Sphaerisporangium sp. NPDC051017]|uniref:PIG-L deacetylase family protein n=1 Tax=Sphaerisporangium sp. NPDC051017 TaxID=3154636 RepID=UPI0034312D52